MSQLEERLLLQLKALKLPLPEREYYFAKPRRWRFDFAWPDENLKLAAEVEGGIWTGKSRHISGKGFENDAAKYNTATLMGWRVLRFTGGMVKSGLAVQTIAEALKQLKFTRRLPHPKAGKEDYENHERRQ